MQSISAGSGVCLALLAMPLSSPAVAQAVASGQPQNVTEILQEDIVVTAQKRGPANVQNVPAAITAFGEAQLQAASQLPPEQRYAAIARLAGMTQFFAERGIAAEQGAACLANGEKATQLAAATQTASDKYNVTGTPWFFINGKDVGTQTWATLEPMLQTAGAR